MSRTRVLHTITRLIRGGADENTILTVYGLDAGRYEVDLLYGGESQPGGLLRRDRSDVSCILISKLCRPLAPLRDLIALFQIYCLIRRRRYHIVHSHTAKAGILTRIAAWMARVPVVVHTVHGSTFGDFVPRPRRDIYRLAERLCGAITHAMICVGKDLRTQFLAAGVALPERYWTIRSGMDLALFRAASEGISSHELRQTLSLEPTEFLVGNVSRLENRKGQTHYLRAAAILCRRHEAVRFLLVGEGPDRDQLEAQAQSLGIRDRVLFTGFRDDIAEILAMLDLVVLTSLWEGLPRVLVQAAAVGRPIVTFEVEGAAEVVDEGVNGFIVERGNVDALVEKISWCVDNRACAARMGCQGRSRIDEAWDAQVMVEEIDRLYTRLLGV